MPKAENTESNLIFPSGIPKRIPVPDVLGGEAGDTIQTPKLKLKIRQMLATANIKYVEKLYAQHLNLSGQSLKLGLAFVRSNICAIDFKCSHPNRIAAWLEPTHAPKQGKKKHNIHPVTPTTDELLLSNRLTALFVDMPLTEASALILGLVRLHNHPDTSGVSMRMKKSGKVVVCPVGTDQPALGLLHKSLYAAYDRALENMAERLTEYMRHSLEGRQHGL